MTEIDASTLQHDQPLRCRAHREWIKSLGCCVPGCRRAEIDPHHVRTRGAGGGDDECVNFCRHHHNEFHQIGRITWQRKYRILLLPHAAKLAQRSRELGILPPLGGSFNLASCSSFTKAVASAGADTSVQGASKE